MVTSVGCGDADVVGRCVGGVDGRVPGLQGRPRPKPPQRLRKMPNGPYESNLGHGFGPLRAMGSAQGGGDVLAALP